MFSRWKSHWPRTWPYAVFKRHHTELNDLYWAGALAAHSSERTVKISNQVGTQHIATALPVRSSVAKRMNFTIDGWKAEFKEFGNWNRLAALMSLSSYFETYLSAVCQLALLSDPGLLLHSSKAVDGIALLKSFSASDEFAHIKIIRDEVKSITQGEWNSRLTSYERFFGTAPAILKAAIPSFESIRHIRNGVGHTFGRLIPEYEDPLVFLPKPFQRLSEERLLKLLGEVEKVALAIDNQLQPHVGAFEALLTYHRLEKKVVAGKTEAQVLRGMFPFAQGAPPGKLYFEELIKFYKKI
jgi:hypothetical protein